MTAIVRVANHRFAGTIDDLSSLEQVKKVMKSDKYNKELEGDMEDNLLNIEKQLGVSGMLRCEYDSLVIKKELTEKVNLVLDPKIKGFMLVDANGDYRVRKDVPVRALAANLVDQGIVVFNIGAQETTPNAKILK